MWVLELTGSMQTMERQTLNGCVTVDPRSFRRSLRPVARSETMWWAAVEVASAVQAIPVALMALHAHLRTLTSPAAQLLKTLIAPVAWHRLQRHQRHQPHHAQCHPQHLLLRHQLPLLCQVAAEDVQSTATQCALMEITALGLSVVWMVRLVHRPQPASRHVSCPSQSTVLDDHQLSL